MRSPYDREAHSFLWIAQEQSRQKRKPIMKIFEIGAAIQYHHGKQIRMGHVLQNGVGKVLVSTPRATQRWIRIVAVLEAYRG